MNLLILTQYYPPETGAPQNRLHSLALNLKNQGFDVEVLTAMPNYPKMEIFPEYKGKWKVEDEFEGIKIYRSAIYVSKSKGIFKRLVNYFSFVITSFIRGLSLKKYDFILCESPPLFLGISAYLLSRLKGSKLIFNVSDLWPESAEKLNLVNNKFMLKMAYKLEEFLYKKSALVSGQTQGIVKNIKDRFPKVRTYWIPNGVDFHIFNHNNLEPKEEWRNRLGYAQNDFILLYAGILGHAQGLEVILHAADLVRSKPDIKFLIVGDGPEKEVLHKLAEKLKLENVKFIPNTPKSEMPAFVNNTDAYIVPLKRLDIFLGAIPSKLFEPMALKKPILLGVDGEARDLFITKGNGGLYFTPEHSEELAEKILELYNNPELMLKLGQSGYEYVKNHFDRVKIANGFREELLHILRNGN